MRGRAYRRLRAAVCDLGRIGRGAHITQFCIFLTHPVINYMQRNWCPHENPTASMTALMCLVALAALCQYPDAFRYRWPEPRTDTS